MTDDNRSDPPGRRRDDGTAARLHAIEQWQQAIVLELRGHVEEDRGAFDKLHACVDENTRLTRETRDSILLLLAREAARKGWTIAQCFRRSAVWLTPILAFVGIVYALWMWLLGKGPFPHP